MTLRIHPDEIVATSDSPLLQVAPHWERVRLGEIAEVVNGAAFKSDLFTNDGTGMPLIRIRDIGSCAPSVNYTGPFEDHQVVHKDNLLIGMDGDFRIARWSGADALLNQRVCRLELRCNHFYDSRFLEFCVQPYLEAVHAQTSAVTVKHLSSRTIAELPIPLPPRAEQERIVAALEEHLSHLDAARANLDSVGPRARALEGVSAQVALQVDAELVALGSVATIGSGSTPKRSNPRYWSGGDVPWITSGALNVPTVTAPSELITSDALRETSVKLWPSGTVLLAMYGEGKTRGRASELMIDATCNQACAAIDVDRSVLRPSYVRWFLNSRYVANRRLASGGVQPNLNLGLVKEMKIPVPPLQAQDRVIASLEEVTAGIALARDNVRKAQLRANALERSILAAAFSGKLVPQDSSDEPASVLLEKIRAERAAAKSKRRAKAAKS